MTGARWPNLFLVGAAKAGTTSLYDSLARHPAIFMAPMKEPHFFSRIEPAGPRAAFFPHVDDQVEYLDLFRDATDQGLLGEASTSYLWDRGAAERIHEVSPGARILIMLRHPIHRAYSQYWNDVREGIETRSFLGALKDEQGSGPGEWGVTSLYIGCGLYADQVARYLDRFGTGVQVLMFEDFVADQAGTVARVHEFLNVGEPGDGAEGRRMNPSSLPRNRFSRAVLGSGGMRRLARATVPRRLRLRVRQALLQEAPPPPMDPAARALLAEVFRPEVEKLADLLGISPPWDLRVDAQPTASRENR